MKIISLIMDFTHSFTSFYRHQLVCPSVAIGSIHSQRGLASSHLRSCLHHLSLWIKIIYNMLKLTTVAIWARAAVFIYIGSLADLVVGLLIIIEHLLLLTRHLLVHWMLLNAHVLTCKLYGLLIELLWVSLAQLLLANLRHLAYHTWLLDSLHLRVLLLHNVLLLLGDLRVLASHQCLDVLLLLSVLLLLLLLELLLLVLLVRHDYLRLRRDIGVTSLVLDLLLNLPPCLIS
jgi:hypothetical protein